MISYSEYQAALEKEFEFWRKVIIVDKNPWAKWAKRPDKPNSLATYPGPLIEEYLPQFEAKNDFRILDIGSGPASRFSGYTKAQVIAIDPLAHRYYGLTIEEKHTRPISIYAEDIGKVFPDGYFDIVHAANSLDHAFSPSCVMQQIAKVLKDDGIFVVITYLNEADRNSYSGLHQHNFMLTKEGTFVERNTGINLLSGTNLSICKFHAFDDIRVGAVFSKKSS